MFLFGCHSRTLGLTQHSVCKEKKEKNGVRRDPGAQERTAWAGPCAVACGVCLARAHLPPGSGAVGGALAVPLEGARRTLHAHGVELMQAVEGGPCARQGGPRLPARRVKRVRQHCPRRRIHPPRVRRFCRRGLPSPRPTRLRGSRVSGPLGRAACRPEGGDPGLPRAPRSCPSAPLTPVSTPAFLLLLAP